MSARALAPKREKDLESERERERERGQEKLCKTHCKISVLSLNPRFPADTCPRAKPRSLLFASLFFTPDIVEQPLATINLRAQSTFSFSPLSLSLFLLGPFPVGLVDQRETHSIPRRGTRGPPIVFTIVLKTTATFRALSSVQYFYPRHGIRYNARGRCGGWREGAEGFIGAISARVSHSSPSSRYIAPGPHFFWTTGDVQYLSMKRSSAKDHDGGWAVGFNISPGVRAAPEDDPLAAPSLAFRGFRVLENGASRNIDRN